MSKLEINHQPLSVFDLAPFAKSGHQLNPSPEVLDCIKICRQFLDEKMSVKDAVFYGINTGFGDLCDVVISNDDLSLLQTNLIQSHACGMGDEVPIEITRLMIFLKLRSLSYGHSGISLEVFHRLVDFYNLDILPVIYQMGSLGASGDLAPLSHLSLPLIGDGEVYFNEKKISTAELYEQLDWKALPLHSKEGLALINGTQFMGAYGVWCLNKAWKLLESAELLGALSGDAFGIKYDPFDASIHKIRNQKGQIQSAQKIRNYLKDSQIGLQEKEQTQDPYSFRCMPQVHGASRQGLKHITETFNQEINAVTDNPNVFPAEDKILSGGNFHGQPLAVALDYLAILAAELGSISERRTYLLLSGKRGLPPFLVKNPGLNSGLMIPQYTAASLVSQNKQLCTPASVDSITSSNGQEDHVSMGANAATKCFRVIENLERILAIELLTATQAIEFKRPLKSSSKIEMVLKAYRESVSFNQTDRVLKTDLDLSLHFIQNKLPKFTDIDS